MDALYKILRIFDKYFEELVCSIGLILVASCVFLQFLTRSIIGSAKAWPEEVAIYGMVWAMYIGACMAVREKGQMRILILVKCMPRRISIFIIMFADLIWFSFCIFMVVTGIQYINLLIEHPVISPSLGVDQRWPQSVIPFGFALMGFRIVQHYVLWFSDGCPELPA